MALSVPIFTFRVLIIAHLLLTLWSRLGKHLYGSIFKTVMLVEDDGKQKYA
jgi:hypothetical protein